MINEDWKRLNDNYDISTMGRIRNIKTGHVTFGSNVKGYKNIIIKRSRFYVHRLVGETFLGPHNHDDVINHKNGNKKDNRVENLEWVTQLKNIEHSKHLPNYQINLKNRLKLHETFQILKLYYVYGLGYRLIGKLYNRSTFTIRKVVKSQTHHLPLAIDL